MRKPPNKALQPTDNPRSRLSAAELGRSMNKEGIEKLEAQASSLLTLLIRTSAKYMFLRPMMSDHSLSARMDTEGKRAGFEDLRNLLYWDLIQEIVKLCEDNDPRTPTIRKIVEKIREASVAKIFEEKYSRRVLPRIEGEDDETRRMLEKREEEEWRNRFKEIYDRLLQNTDALLESASLAGYKEIRDRLVAHNELRKIDDRYEFFDISVLNLKYGYERRILEMIKEIVDDINSVIRNAGFSWDSFYEPEKRDVCAFWEIENIEQGGAGNGD